LFGVTAHDALTLATVPPLLAIIMILASRIPARRAMRMDPLVAIREE
jgi:ABC-type lipoprotein release transport system permease subunit